MKRKAVEIFNAALDAADPYNSVRAFVSLDGSTLNAGPGRFDLDSFDRIVVVGAGKGTAPMAAAVEDILGERITRGLVVVKYGHTWPGGGLGSIEQVEASHPLPDEAGVSGAERIKEILRASDEKTLVVCLLSGGASALLVSPVEGITLEEMRTATDLVMSAGADIFELNSVRKHLSAVKGGRLAELAAPATLLTLIVSDVIGDRLDTIGSGPTVPDGTTFEEALSVVEKYGLAGKMPGSVMRHLRDGVEKKVEETPKGTEDFFKHTENIIVGGLRTSLEAAVKKAEELDFRTELVTDELTGEAKEAAAMLAKKAQQARTTLERGDALCLLSGGETTVKVTGKGLGGRNQELALAFALEVEGEGGLTLLSAGTDGTDGPTDAAGAVVDGETVVRARELGIDPEKYLAENDSYRFFDRLDQLAGTRTHLKTGPTGTNVMDVQIITVEI